MSQSKTFPFSVLVCDHLARETEYDLHWVNTSGEAPVQAAARAVVELVLRSHPDDPNHDDQICGRTTDDFEAVVVIRGWHPNLMRHDQPLH